jgi:Bacterial Ig-like domain (group 3)
MVFAGLVTAGLVVGVGGVPVLAAQAAPAATAPAATAPVHGVWLPARELPGTSVASGIASVDAVACAPGAECVTADDTMSNTGASSDFLLSEKSGSWGKAQQIPGLAALAGSGGFAQISSVACPASGYCVAVGSYGNTASHAFVAWETRGAWGNAAQIPGLAALDTGGLGSANLVSCPSVGNCTVAGDYGTGSAANPVLHEFVASEANGAWRGALPVPGLDALADVAGGNEATVTSLSCASAGNCALGGEYLSALSSPAAGPVGLGDVRRELASARSLTRSGQSARLAQFGHSARLALARPLASAPQATGQDAVEPFVASEVNGTWSNATAPAIPGLTGSGQSFVTSVQCPAAGHCVAAGAYYVSDTSNAGGAFYVTQSGTGWSAPTTNSIFAAAALACSSAGNCTAAGSDVRGVATVQREVNGAWGAASELPGASGLAYQGKKAVLSEVEDLACPSAGNCSAVGLYATGTAANPTALESFVASQVNGAWSAAQVPPGLASLSTGGFTFASGLACASAANCLTGGEYAAAGAHGGIGAFVLTEVPVQPTGTLIGLSTGTVHYGREQAERVAVKVVTAHLGIPTGRVVVWAGTKAVCVIPLTSGKGSCLLTAKELRTGTYHLVARYSATAPYAQSTSVARTLVVKK